MSEARDMERAALTALEAARNLRVVVNDLAEERKQIDWAVERLRDERLRLDETLVMFLDSLEKALDPLK